MCEKHPSNDHHFPAHKYKYFFKLFSFSVAKPNLNLTYIFPVYSEAGLEIYFE